MSATCSLGSAACAIWVATAIDVATNIMVMILPIRLLIGLRICNKQRIGIDSIFSPGFVITQQRDTWYSSGIKYTQRSAKLGTRTPHMSREERISVYMMLILKVCIIQSRVVMGVTKHFPTHVEKIHAMTKTQEMWVTSHVERGGESEESIESFYHH